MAEKYLYRFKITQSNYDEDIVNGIDIGFVGAYTMSEALEKLEKTYGAESLDTCELKIINPFYEDVCTLYSTCDYIRKDENFDEAADDKAFGMAEDFLGFIEECDNW